MNLCIHMGIDYAKTYKSVYVLDPRGKRTDFATDDPVVDFRDATAFAYLLHTTLKTPVMSSSSFEGFCWDVGGYKFDEDDMLVIDADTEDA